MRLALALWALLALPALADTLVTKDGKTYRCPGAFGMAEGSRIFTCPSYTIEDPDRIEYERDKPVGSAPSRAEPARAAAPPAPVANVPNGPAPPAGAAFETIEVGTKPGAIWIAMEKARKLPTDTWAVLELSGEIAVGPTSQVLNRSKVVLRSAPRARGAFDCSGMGEWWGGKACLIVSKSDVHIENVDLFGARRNSNTAAIFVEKDLVVSLRGVRAWDNHNGVLTAPGCTMLIEDSEFHDNGSGDGLTHNLYLNGCKQVVVRRVKSWFTPGRTTGAHGLKARGSKLLVEDSDIMAGEGAAIDIPYGGEYLIRDTILRRPDGRGGNVLMVGMEPLNSGRVCSRGDGPGRLENVTVVNERAAGGAMRNNCPTPAVVAGGKIPKSVALRGFEPQ